MIFVVDHSRRNDSDSLSAVSPLGLQHWMGGRGSRRAASGADGAGLFNGIAGIGPRRRASCHNGGRIVSSRLGGSLALPKRHAIRFRTGSDMTDVGLLSSHPAPRVVRALCGSAVIIPHCRQGKGRQSSKPVVGFPRIARYTFLVRWADARSQASRLRMARNSCTTHALAKRGVFLAADNTNQLSWEQNLDRWR